MPSQAIPVDYDPFGEGMPVYGDVSSPDAFDISPVVRQRPIPSDPLANAPELKGQTLTPYSPSWRDQAASAIIGDAKQGSRRVDLAGKLLGSVGIPTGQLNMADLTPLGAVFGAQEAARQGDYKGAALAGLMALPGAGAVERGIARTAEGLGSRAAGAARNLPMDQASRLARQQEMGFRTNLPVYHGTAAPEGISAFDPAMRGSSTGTELARLGVSTTPQPELAAGFADLAAQKGSGSGQQVLKLFHRADNPGQMTLSGTESRLEVAANIKDAWDRGHDAILIHNFITDDGPKQILIVKNENQLRVPWAKFDPARKLSPDLLAGITAAGGTVLPVGTMLAQPVEGDPFAQQ